MNIFWFISAPLLAMIFGWAWLMSLNSVVYFEQRRVGIVLWLCCSATAIFSLKAAGLSTAAALTVVVLTSVIGFIFPKITDSVLRRLFKDPANSLPSLTALIK